MKKISNLSEKILMCFEIILILLVSQYFVSANILNDQFHWRYINSPLLVRVHRSPQSGAVAGAVEDEPPPLSDYNYDDDELKQPPPVLPAPAPPPGQATPPDGNDEEDQGLQKNKSRKPQEMKLLGDEIPPFPESPSKPDPAPVTEANESPLGDDSDGQGQVEGQFQEPLENMQFATPPADLADESDGIISAKSKTTVPPDRPPKQGDDYDENDDNLSKNKAANQHDKTTTRTPDDIMKPMEKLKMKLEETTMQLEETHMRLEETTMKLGETTTKLTETMTKLEETTTKLEETVKDLNGTKKKLRTTTTTLEETITTLEETTTKLKNTGKKLEKTTAELNETKEELMETKVKLNETTEKLEEITHSEEYQNTTKQKQRDEYQSEDVAKTSKMCFEIPTTMQMLQTTTETTPEKITESEQKIDAAGANEIKEQEEEEHKPGMPYKFKYEISDEHGNDYGHKAKSNGEVVKGEYHVVLPDGTLQLVRYTADWKNGFVARVKYIRASPAHEDE